jgi:hypothetical protein
MVEPSVSFTLGQTFVALSAHGLGATSPPKLKYAKSNLMVDVTV